MARSLTVMIVAGVIAIGLALPSFSQNDADYEALITETSSSGFLVDGAEHIDHLRALELYEQGVVFIDVRPIWAFNLGHIRGAVGLELKTQFSKESLAEHAKKDQPVVFYCTHSGCKRPAISSAKALMWGYSEVYYFVNGWTEWSGNGYDQDKP